MTNPTPSPCLIQQAACGRIVGESVCPKCGMRTDVRYVSQEDMDMAVAKGTALYWENHAQALERTIQAQEKANREQFERAELERAKAESAGMQGQKEKQEAEALRAKEKAEMGRLEREEKQRLAIERARHKPSEVFQDLPNAPQMVVLPSGSFMMGSAEEDTDGYPNERPQHRVTIAHQLAMGRYPVTFEEWDACVADGGVSYKPEDEGWGRGKRPVINVSWNDAQSYIVWLNKKLNIAPDDPYRYRLPTEVEWEYTARAGSQTKSCFDDRNLLDERVWYYETSSNRTQPVGEKKANEFGMHDMLGNVNEWVQDIYQNDYNGAPSNGVTWERAGSVNERVRRGGSWHSFAQYVRANCRSSGLPGLRKRDDTGFRLARTLP